MLILLIVKKKIITLILIWSFGRDRIIGNAYVGRYGLGRLGDAFVSDAKHSLGRLQRHSPSDPKIHLTLPYPTLPTIDSFCGLWRPFTPLAC